MLALFKNDQFSVEGELAMRQAEVGLVNPSISRDRPSQDHRKFRLMDRQFLQISKIFFSDSCPQIFFSHADF
jgi:hypothetical protein